MHRRSLLRSLAALTPLALAGCGEYSSDPGTPPQDGDSSGENSGSDDDRTSTETIAVDPDALAVSYRRLHYESDGEAVAQVTVESSSDQLVRAAMVINFTVGEESASVTEDIEVEGEDSAQFRVPLGEPVEDVELGEITFTTPS